MKMTKRNAWWLPLLCLMVAALLCVAACGGDEETPTGTSAATTANRVDPATETAPAPTETAPAPTETDTAPTETDTAPTETDPAPAETDPAPTETDSLPVETAPAPAETDSLPVETDSDTSPAETETAPQPDTVTLHFAGEGITTPDQTILVGGTALRPRDPEREGYAFLGWSVEGGELFDFSTPLTADLTLYAVWEDVRQDGSAERPYRIATAEDLMTFSERMNDPEAEGFEAFCQAHFVLTADIDMTGYSYVSAGQTVVLREGEADEVTLGGFMGEFDGAGHTIRGLTIYKSLRSTVYYVGLFGVTDRAYIHDLTLEQIEYTVESGANTSSIGVSVGGVAGYSSRTSYFNVGVSGVIETRLCADNPANIGGLCGSYAVSAGSGQAYAAYVENCSVDIETTLGRFDDGERGVLEGASNGGLIGYMSTTSSTVGLLNCTVSGKVYGGKYVGGIVGYISGSYVSLVNCANYAPVTATGTNITYTGGLVGFSSGDNTVMDCLSLGRVKGVKAPQGSAYKSWTGGLLGYAFEDDYEMYYDAGIAVINSYYLDSVATYDLLNTAGTALPDATAFDATFAQETLHWDPDILRFAEDGYAYPTDKRPTGTWTLTLREADGSTHTEERSYADGMYAMAGEPEPGQSAGTQLFFDWMHGEGVRLRFYLPVIKDMTLTACCGDVSGIAGVYTGTWTLHESGDAGTLILQTNGSVQWIHDTVIRGTYTWDGQHIEIEFFSNIGSVSGTIEGSSLAFTVDAGMSGSVAYAFRKSDLRFVGEYFSEIGDSLTFSGEDGISFRAEEVNGGYPISGSFIDRGEWLEVSGFEKYYVSFSVSVAEDGALTVTAVPLEGKGKALSGVTFAPPTATRYEGQPFVDTYYCPYLNLSVYDGTPYLDMYTLSLNADGTVTYQGGYQPKTGHYYVFREGTYIVLTLEGYTSIFHYDAEQDVVWGTLERGVTAKTTLVLLPVSEGEVKLFVLDGSRNDILMTNGTRSFLVRDKQLHYEAVIEAESFSDGARITIDGQDYRAVYSRENGREGYSLLSIGDEEGTYHRNGVELRLDGIGGIGGDLTGSYWRYDDTIVLLTQDDDLIAFSLRKAEADGGQITELAGDGYRGVWYIDREQTGEDGQPQLVEKYYKLLLDGCGHATFMYWNADYEEYRYNWGTAWTDYTLTATGVHCEFNPYQVADLVFYYEKQLVYSKSFGHMGETVLVAAGYTGATTPPALPTGLVGSYTGRSASGVAVVLNLRQDLTGSWRGQPFTGIYDGADSLHFQLDGVSYSLNIRTMTLTGGEETIRLTGAGEITEVIPAGLCGSFSGVWSGINISDGEIRTVTVAADGLVTYQGMEFTAAYSSSDGSVTGHCGAYTIRLVWSASTHSYAATVTMSDAAEGASYEWTCAELQ